MSHRPSAAKKIARLSKSLRKSPDGFIDLVRWLRDRGYASTTGQAKAIILAKRVRSESHVLGVGQGIVVKEGKLVVEDQVYRHVPAKLRGSIEVLPEAVEATA